MLRITIPAKPETEWWDEVKEEFVTIPGQKEQTLQLEHSLVSLSKWESRWCKPFLDKKEKTEEETLDYIKCMTITQNVPEEVYDSINNDIITKVNEYIDSPMTATWFSEETNKGKGKNNGEIVTAELIYYWMVAHNIPFECQKWHLNRLITLIRVCNVKNAPSKKMSLRDRWSQNAALNAARKKKLNTKG